jgi:glycosyltransferase involved in cell wall biosynthesis
MMSEPVTPGLSSRAAFMTAAMWFVWLLRADIRGKTAPSNVKAQRDFISWWLLWAHAEYPAVFTWSGEHAGIAMELVALENGLLCPRLLVRLYDARDDLREAFPLNDPEGLADYFCWYRLHAPRELAAAPSLLNDCLAITEEPSQRQPWFLDGTRVPRIATMLSRSIPGLIRGSIHEPGTRLALAAWYMKEGGSLIPDPSSPGLARSVITYQQSLRGDGVNVIGFVNGHSGLAEDARMVSVGLAAVGVRHALIDAAADTKTPQSPDVKDIPISDSPVYSTSIYCMSAFDMATLYLRRGPAFFAGQYRIGYWPWELARFPDIWVDVYQLVDEIWTGSEFTANAYRANCPKPVTCLPAPVTVHAVRRRALAMFGKGAFVFTYPFDPNSYLARKNPIALVRAFRVAFPAEDRKVALLLRVNGVIPSGPDRSALLQVIGDDQRIVIMEGTLDRADSLGITASSDCLVSPHRAEGFGRNIAEAILLGVPVLATAYSGCEDFLAPDEGLAFRLQDVVAGQYPFGEGLSWAEPIISDMAAKMKLERNRMRRHGRTERERLASRTMRFAEAYSPCVTGRAFADRLDALQLISSVHDAKRPAGDEPRLTTGRGVGTTISGGCETLGSGSRSDG